MVPYIDITARWRPRVESTAELATRLAHWLERIVMLDPRFARWHRGGMRHRSAVPRVVSLPPIIDELRVWLEENPIAESHHGRKQIVGYSIMARRPKEAEPHANFWLNPRCGPHASWFYNRIGITFFTDRDKDNAHHLNAIVREALLLSASIWDCDWGAVAQGNYEDRSLPQNDLLKYPSGWMVYLDHALASRLHDTPEVAIEKLAHGGTLLTAVTNTVFDRRNALHIAAARRLQAALAPLNVGQIETGSSA